MTEFFKGKELPLTKKVFDQLANWVERQRNRLQSQQSVEATEGEEDDEEAQANKMRLLMTKKCNSYAIRSCLEALWFAYGHAMTPDLPTKSLYQQLWAREISPTAAQVPKLMFTIFNGGKAMSSKVKFSRFYVIMNLKVQDVSVDANLLYYKLSAAIKKAITGHKLGEAGFKANVSGAYFNALDTVNDSFKLLEDAINSTGVNTNERKYFTIGINADS